VRKHVDIFTKPITSFRELIANLWHFMSTYTFCFQDFGF
jgi:hypothetical protein